MLIYHVLTMCNCRFAEELAEDNLSLQWENEALRNEIAELSCALQKMHHETKLMGSQLRNAVSRVTSCRSCHVFSLDESLQNDSVSHSLISNLQHTMAQLQSRYESQCSLLSKFIPFVNEAVLVEHAANVVFELMQSCTNPHDSEIDGCEIPSSVSIASTLTCSVAPGPVASQAQLNNTMTPVQDEETNDTFANVAGHRVAAHLQESSFVSPTRFHGHDYDDTRASSNPAALGNQDISVEVGHCESSAHSDIQSYRDLLLSYEHELIAAWSREADLQKELQSKCATSNNLQNRRENRQVFQQARSLSPHGMSPCDLEILSTTNMIVLEAEKLMLETRIPSSDTFIDDMFKLQVHEIFHILTRQITEYYSMNRVVQPSLMQDGNTTSLR
jgi:hypothetical protein